MFLSTQYIMFVFAVPLLGCDDRQFACEDHKFCIPINWKCDGEADCQDGSDENPIECGKLINAILFILAHTRS